MNSVLLDIIVKGRGFHIPRYPQLILGDSKKYLQGDILDANAVVTEIDKSVTKLIDAAPDTLNTLKEIADSLHGDADIAGTLISRITDVENSVADLAGLQSTDILELISRLGDVETKSTKNAQDIATIQTNKVDAISGKQLSTEDYTTAEKTKLAGIEAGALVNPANVSAFTNDAGYLTEHQSLADYATQAWVNNQGFITEHQDISGKANIADLATVATSGSYNDLTNKPVLTSFGPVGIQDHMTGPIIKLVNSSGVSITTILANGYAEEWERSGDEAIPTIALLKDKLDGKENPTAIVASVNSTDVTLPVTSLVCEAGKYYRIDVPVETLAVILPSMNGVTTVKTVVLYLTAGTTPAVTISAVDGKDVLYQDGFGVESGKTYEVNALFNGAAWVVASVEIIVE